MGFLHIGAELSAGPPDELRIGAKTGWFDNTLHVNAAAYIEDWNRFQFVPRPERVHRNQRGQRVSTARRATSSGSRSTAWRSGRGHDHRRAPDHGLLRSGVGGVIITQCPGPVDPWGPNAPKGTSLPERQFKRTSGRYELILDCLRTCRPPSSTKQQLLIYRAADPTAGQLSMPVPVRAVLGPLRRLTLRTFRSVLRPTTGRSDDQQCVRRTRAAHRSAQCTIGPGGALYTSTNQPRTFGVRLTHKID